MGDEFAQHRADQAGITNAIVGMLCGLASAMFGGAFWLCVRPSSIDIKGALAAPFSIAMLGVMAAVAGWAFLMVRLGGADPASEHRRWYVDFRDRIAHNDGSINYALGDYGALVRWALRGLDRFFGDTGAWRSSLFPRAFGLRKPAPLWTPSSYSRCLLLALGYPILVVVLTWVTTNHIGPLERALGMHPAPDWQRGVAMVPLAIGVAAAIAADRLDNAKVERAMQIVFTLAILAAYKTAGGLAVGAATAVFPLLAFAAGGDAAILTGFMMFAATLDFGILSRLVLVMVASFGILLVEQFAAARGRFGVLLAVHTVVLLAVVLALPAWSTPHPGRPYALLYFLGLLALVNAPFDWVAFGFTRLLLRLGLQRGGFAPLWLGALDLLVSLVIMALLAVAMLWATELFNDASALGRSAPMVAIEPLLRAIADPARRGDPSLVWLYATLFSTQVPALLNIVLAAFCAIRGVRPVNRWMMRRLPPGGGMGIWQRMPVALAWGGQLGGAVALGVGLLYFCYVWGAVALIDGTFGVTLAQLLHAVSLAPLLR